MANERFTPDELKTLGFRAKRAGIGFRAAIIRRKHDREDSVKKSRAAAGPSVKRILDHFDGFRHEENPKKTAQAVKELISEGGRGDRVLAEVNKVIDGHGVEAIRGGEDYDRGGYYGDVVAEYVNMGDTYTGTVLYDVNAGKFLLTTWGDWVEKNERKYKIR